MQPTQRTFPQYFSGTLRIDQTKYLAKRSTLERQNLVRPDFFDSNGCWYRLLEIDKALTAIKITGSGFVLWGSPSSLTSTSISHRIRQLIIPVELPDNVIPGFAKPLAENLRELGPLVHIASASIEEALIKAIIRQVITANHAKKLIHRFITRYGESYEYGGLICYRFPTSERIMRTPLDDLISCGLGFKAKLIKSVVEKLAEGGLTEKLNRISANLAIEQLQEIKGIGKWTAHITLCDLSGDWSLYPFDDLAVRTWAPKLLPNHRWPQKPNDFKKEWEDLNGNHVGQITFYLLALAAFVSANERIQ